MVNEIVQTQIASQVRTLDHNDGGGEISPRRLVRKDGKYFFRIPSGKMPIAEIIIENWYLKIGHYLFCL